MKFLKLSMLLVIAAVVFSVSCSKDDNKGDEVEDLQPLTSFNIDNYTIELFNNSGQFKVGYNQIFIRLKDTNGNYVEQASMDWIPMMTMNMNGMTNQHSCPFSSITKVSGKKTLFEGYIVFNMASDASSFWNLKFNFSVGGQEFETDKNISVISADSDFMKTYTTAMGSDQKMYLLALVEPSEPKIGVNDFIVALFSKENNMDFPKVENYRIKVDPRMPGMGNHSAPGSEDLTQQSNGFYQGKVGFSMSGYWKINMILEDEAGTVIKGEPVTEQNLESSLNFKIEF